MRSEGVEMLARPSRFRVSRRPERGPGPGAGSIRTAVLALLASSALACVSNAERSSLRGDSSRITAEELSRLRVYNAYDAVALLRPRWLQSRGPRSEQLPTEIIVAQGSSYLGPLSSLRDVPLESVRGFRYLDASEANSYIAGLGSRHVEAAIVIEFGPR